MQERCETMSEMRGRSGVKRGEGEGGRKGEVGSKGRKGQGESKDEGR